ncbi:MAG: glycoside hydrolase family 5 protein [Treponema sp.]|jgi:endoglucanase|nr:glycoside hydrolase family 5 protein [Treponema sp.]
MKKTSIFIVSVLIITLFVSCISKKTPAEAPQFDPVVMQPVPDDPKPFNDISASDLVVNIKIGWNLGNTLDAPNETAWGNPKTKKSNIDAIKAAGFDTVRIPVSWSHHVDRNYNINPNFMERVKEIVGYAIDNDMYVLLNSHHDETIFKFKNSEMAVSKAAFERVWEQIAGQFKNENEKLIFEGLNEPRTKGSSAEWTGGTKEERDNLNEMEQIFVDVVRASGSNNTKRILMVSTYAASAEQAAIDGVKIPNDPSNTMNKFIVSVHSYSPYFFALHEGGGSVSTWNKNNSNDTNGIKIPLDRAYNKFVSKGIPVILGEFGAINRNNEDARAEWAEYYVSYAKSKDMPCVWWDDGGNFKLLNRGNNSFYFPKIKDALIKGAN